MFLRNTWYVAAWSHDIGQELTPLTILGDRIVFYRTSDGQAVALEDACPHRKLPLSLGRLKADHVECGYHGLTFDCTGACVNAPTQGRIPSTARVLSYPVVDRYDLLWIWMGDPAQADPANIMLVENFDDPSWGITSGDAMTVDCNYLYITDNLLDPAHVSWVHQSSFAGEGCEDSPLEIELSDQGAIVSRWMTDRELPPYYAPLVKFSGRCDRLQHYEVRFPALAINKSIFTPVGTGGRGRPLPEDAYVMLSYNLMTPIDADHTRYFWFQNRNTDPDDPEITASVAEGTRAAFEEDRAVLNAVHKGMATTRTPNIQLALDAGPLRFRRALEQKILAEAPALAEAG